MKAKSYRL